MKHQEELKGLRDKSNAELKDELAGVRQELFKFRTDMAMRSLSNVKSIRTARKRVARILTLAHERELESSGDI